MQEQVKVNLIAADGISYSQWVPVGKNLWEVLAISVSGFTTECGGRGTCGKCKVRVSGEISPITEEEKAKLLPDELSSGERLACYARVMGTVDVQLPYMTDDISLNSTAKTITGQKAAQYRRFFIPGLDKQNPQPVYQRIRQVLPDLEFKLTVDNLNELAGLDREGRPSLELIGLILDNKYLLHAGRNEKPAYGIALDLGTTSLLVSLIDLVDGHVAGVISQTNMQRIYGADIISRVSYCLEQEDGLEKLHQILLNNINSMIEDVLKPVDAGGNDVYCYSVVGNPVMLHLFMNLKVNGFASAPYAGLFLDGLEMPAAALGLQAGGQAPVRILPQAGGFVGADAVAGLLVLPTSARRYLFIDIGTNGEIILADGKTMWATSAAAGPALEGGNISCGMRAASGAIDRIWLTETEEIQFNVLGSGVPRGICGSAILDMLAVLLRVGYIDQSGAVTEKGENYPLYVNGFLLTDNSGYGAERVIFTIEDIRQVQLAKAAIRTGIDILLNRAQMTWQDLEYIYLAGAFGQAVDVLNAIETGLLPPVLPSRVKLLGNAAMTGAIAALLNKDNARRAADFQQRIKYIDLALEPQFQELFMKNINLG
mgnify:CR=1 FL=1